MKNVILNNFIQNKQLLYESEVRKNTFLFITRKIIKQALNIKNIDFLIYDYILSELRKNFIKNKFNVNLHVIALNLENANKYLEDFININLAQPEYNQNSKYNFLVYKIFNFII
jgi:hypothetical protein